MVYLGASEEWQRQSALLLQARPTTARITTKYKIPNLKSAKYQDTKKRRRDGEAETKEIAAPRIPKAVLVLKTYDPESGVVLKFKTDRAADVGRLISGLGRLGRYMAALPEKVEDTTMEDAFAVEQLATVAASSSEAVPAAPESKSQQVSGGSTSNKKKKKGKR